jgi:hypothetical protein
MFVGSVRQFFLQEARTKVEVSPVKSSLAVAQLFKRHGDGVSISIMSTGLSSKIVIVLMFLTSIDASDCDLKV